MFINSNEKCPVCDKPFTQEDDIVICPHCGTPHHRACYHSLGHCFNADKHKTGFEYNRSAASDTKTVSDEVKNEEQRDYTPPNEQSPKSDEQQGGKTVCPQCGAQINNDAPFCSHCGARQSNVQYHEYNLMNDFAFHTAGQKKYENDTQTIDGKRVADAALVVGANAEKFIPKFLKNKKVSWNWSAFIFGPYYLFYRKMYKQGIIFTALSLVASLIISGIANEFFADQITAFISFYSDNMSSLITQPSAELMNQFMDLYRSIMPIMLASIGINLVIHLIIAIFSDAFYKTKVISVLDKVDKNLEEGASFNTAIPMMNGESLSQEDMRKLYLRNMGGISVFAPIAAYLALNLITTLISSL